MRVNIIKNNSRLKTNRTIALLLILVMLLVIPSSIAAAEQSDVVLEPNGSVYNPEPPELGDEPHPLSVDELSALPDEDDEYDENISLEEVASKLIAAACTDVTTKEYFGFNETKSMAIGECIPVYKTSTHGITKLDDWSYYPIIQGNRVIATLEVMGNDEQTFTLTTYLSDEFNQKYIDKETIAIVHNEALDIVFTSDGKSAKITEYSKEHLQLNDDSINKETANLEKIINGLSTVSIGGESELDIKNSIKEATKTNSNTLDIDNSIDTGSMQITARAELSGFPDYRQTGPTCWAYTMSMIGSYRTGLYISGYTLANTHMGGQIGASPSNIPSYYPKSFYYTSTSRFNVTQSTPNYEKYKNHINNKQPTHLHGSRKTGTGDVNHGVAGIGYSGASVIIMNPARGREVSYPSSFSTMTFGSGTSTYQIYRVTHPTGWHRWGSSWWWMKDSGEYETGWLKDGSNWYWLDTSTGAMLGNVWLLNNGNWYYLKPGGIMAVGNRVWVEKDQRYANFSSSGVWLGYV